MSRVDERHENQDPIADFEFPKAKLRPIDRKVIVPVGLGDIKPYVHDTISHKDVAKIRDGAIAPNLPDWVAVSSAPTRARVVGRPPRWLQHRGQRLEPLFIWGGDDRRNYNDTRYPWGCVCKVITAAGSGSGVIVGPRHVLTASHVVDWNASGAGTVEVHRAGPTFSAATAIAHVMYYTKITGTSVDYSDSDEDYAVLVTADRIGDQFGWMGVRTYNSSWDDKNFWRNIGYPGDVANASFPIYQRDKALDEDEWDYGEARAMTTTADTMKGQSGSPMFAFWSDGPYVVAVVSSQGTFVLSGDENWCAGGSLLTKLVRKSREKYT